MWEGREDFVDIGLFLSYGRWSLSIALLYNFLESQVGNSDLVSADFL